MSEFDDLGREISETVRSAVENLPKDLGQTMREAMGEIFDDDAGNGTDAEEIEQHFEVGPQAEFQVSNVSGQLTIHGADVTAISVRATKRGSRRRMANTGIEIEHLGNRVSVKTRGEHAGRLGIRGNICSVDYDVEVPFACSLTLEGVSADVAVRQTRGDVTLRTVSGDVTLDDVTGDCSLTTVSGDVMATSLDGELQLRTTSGDTTIRASRLRRFNLNTVSGDLNIETPLTSGEHYLAKTTSGDLQITVPEGTGATIQMKSVSGDVSSDLPAEIIKSSRRNWQGRINGGGANVEMNSMSGDLRITAGTGRAPSRPAPPSRPPAVPTHVTPTPSEPSQVAAPSPDNSPVSPASEDAADASTETSTILERLARGEISVEDAMAQLDAVDR